MDSDHEHGWWKAPDGFRCDYEDEYGVFCRAFISFENAIRYYLPRRLDTLVGVVDVDPYFEPITVG